MISKFLRLSGAEKIFVLQAAAWLVWIRLLLALFAYHRVNSLTQRWARPSRKEFNRSHRPPPTAHRLGQLITAAANRIPGTSCLPRALATQIVLCRHGHQAELHIGVNRDNEGRFQAHAWVEHGGQVVIGGSDVTDYKPILRTA